MPFPLAHPAAVLPLRRYCPKWFNFTALVVGAVVPDLGYCFGPLKLENTSHTFAGSLSFCLPAGLVILTALHFCGGRLARPWFDQSNEWSGSLRPWPPRALLVLAGSLLLGIWTHLLWDGFTHKSGWFVQHIQWLQFPIGAFLGHRVRVFQALWYACSFAGVGVLYVAYERWKRPLQGAKLPFPRLPTLFRASAVAAFASVLALLHHLYQDGIVSLIVGLLSVALVLGLGLGMNHRRPTTP
jgi:Domain of unknown function (DUF4184)